MVFSYLLLKVGLTRGRCAGLDSLDGLLLMLYGDQYPFNFINSISSLSFRVLLGCPTWSHPSCCWLEATKARSSRLNFIPMDKFWPQPDLIAPFVKKITSFLSHTFKVVTGISEFNSFRSMERVRRMRKLSRDLGGSFGGHFGPAFLLRRWTVSVHGIHGQNCGHFQYSHRSTGQTSQGTHELCELGSSCSTWRSVGGLGIRWLFHSSLGPAQAKLRADPEQYVPG